MYYETIRILEFQLIEIQLIARLFRDYLFSRLFKWFHLNNLQKNLMIFSNTFLISKKRKESNVNFDQYLCKETRNEIKSGVDKERVESRARFTSFLITFYTARAFKILSS